MYLEELHIEGLGPLRSLAMNLPFEHGGRPKPVILVGGNGSGKTNLLSIIADALFQAAMAHYTDLLPGSTLMQRPFFRLVGGSLISLGLSGGFAILRFRHDNTNYFYKEKAGTIAASTVIPRLAASLHSAAVWKDDGNSKEMQVPDEDARKIFDEGAYVYFPSNRAEVPGWLNSENVQSSAFDLGGRFAQRLRKPIFVERSLEVIQQWILALILESRPDFTFVTQGLPPGAFQIHPVGDVGLALVTSQTLSLANRILSSILGDPQATFAWIGRHRLNKLGIASGGPLRIPGLDALSAGQSTLLSIFGTLVRYADINSSGGAVQSEKITGICLVDEIDAHMHVDLQYRALPALIKLFPSIQFIISSHSPLFVLGMENEFGADGMAVIDMPSGNTITAESYSEFGRALEALQDTKAFAAVIEAAVSTPGKLLVLAEGETDPVYIKTAAELLGRKALLQSVDFEWVGAKDPKSGQGFHTGKNALDQVSATLRAKPRLAGRKVVLLYDNDAKKPNEDHARFHVRSVHTNLANAVVRCGIENLLPAESITPSMFAEKTEEKANGTTIIIKSLRKMELCTYICEEKRTAADFSEFAVLLDMISEISLLPPANV